MNNVNDLFLVYKDVMKKNSSPIMDIASPVAVSTPRKINLWGPPPLIVGDATPVSLAPNSNKKYLKKNLKI